MTRWPLPDPMQAALAQAQLAADAGEVPVGAVVMRDGEVIASAHNAPRTLADPTAHAEVLALRAAAKALGQERLEGCDLWVTLEPCAMCAGAIAAARLERLFYGAADPKSGGVAQGARVFSHPQCHHAPQVFDGIAARDSEQLLTAFFQAKRGG